MEEVSIVPCDSYEYEKVKAALRSAIGAVDGFCGIRAGMTVAIKANLVSFLPPKKAATTHPAVVCALCDLLTEAGCSVVIGDSPGGVYNAAALNQVYRVTGMTEAVRDGVTLNGDFSVKDARFGEAAVAKSFSYTGWLDKADAIIDVCKLKTHGMMGFSCAAKNLFGVIPGTQKPEYHFRFSTYEAFADMIVDLNEYFKPVLSICDAVVGMEGNGPTAGTPRRIGCILASPSTHKLDLVAASVIGLKKEEVPTLLAAYRRGLIPATAEEVRVAGDVSRFRIEDYETITTLHSLGFRGASDNVLGNIFGKTVEKLLMTRPKLRKNQCVGCNRCGELCPAKAIRIEKGKAVIDREKCIRCFCCQEFCPRGAMKIHRTFIAKLLTK